MIKGIVEKITGYKVCSICGIKYKGKQKSVCEQCNERLIRFRYPLYSFSKVTEGETVVKITGYR
jgi:rRNA maturation endonuclease Nob1